MQHLACNQRLNGSNRLPASTTCKSAIGRCSAQSTPRSASRVSAPSSTTPHRSTMAPSFPSASAGSRPRDVTASVSIFQDIKQALFKSNVRGNSYDVVITYHDPFVNLNALEWGIEALVDKHTGERAPQDDEDYAEGKGGFTAGLASRVRTTKLQVPDGFEPGAVVLAAKDGFLIKGRRAFIGQITLKPSGGGPDLVFPANSYLSASQGERIIFEGTPSLRSNTPKGLAQLRDAELRALKDGATSGQRQGNERIYGFDVYHDLGGDPSKPGAPRPPLGGSDEYPYPRRLRTGRPLYADNSVPTETAGGVPWLPADDAFADQKVINFLSSAVAAAIPTVINGIISKVIHKNGDKFSDIKSVLALYYDTPDDAKPGDTPSLTAVIDDLVEDVLRADIIGLVVPEWKEGNVLTRLKNLLKQITGFALPLVLQDSFSQWETDEELGRELLAGQNPLTLVAVASTNDFVRLSKSGSNIPASEAEFKDLLEGKSLSQLVGLPKPRLFVVEHTAVPEEYLQRVNIAGSKTTLHATRGLFYLRDTGYLVPVAIELKSADNQPYTVYTPNSPPSVWRLAKSVFASVDSVMHQLESHWLRTHCCVEPYLIATRRSLSVMHPMFKLIMPHFRYTMAINAAARALLINKDGVIESSFSTGPYSMEASARAYAADWRFDEQGLPADLKKRGLMTAEGKLLVDDYPYAQDGLLIWSALETYFSDYLSLYYNSDADVASDTELQAWWEDIKGPNGGHADKANSPGWPALNSKSNLVFALATIAWSASAHHAAVNFDQYDYSGFMPNRSSAVVKAMPLPGSAEYKKLMGLDPGSEEFQAELLSYLAPLQTTLTVMTTLKLLSNHSEEEQYLSSDAELLGWLTDGKAKVKHAAFLKALQAASQEIDRRNASGEYKTRNKGDAGIPYTLMLPSSGPGVTGRGVPYSISI